MSDFKQELDSELDKRDTHDSASSVAPRKAKFSYLTFFFGIGFISFILGGLLAWAQFKADKTAELIQNRLPSKTAIVNVIESETFRMGNNQKRITLAPLGEQPPSTHSEETTEEEPLSAEEKDIINMIQANAPEPNTSPFGLYRKAYTKSAKPSLSIVIIDLGLSDKRTKSILENFPEGVSIGLSPYSENINELITMAREDGHEVWMMLPLETQDYPLVDSGPLTLLTDASLAQNKDRVGQILKIAEGHAGFIPNKDHVFNGEDGDINPAIKQILETGYALIDSHNTGRSFVANLAYNNDYPHGQNNFWLDDDLTPLALNQRLRQAMELAEAKGNAIMFLRPYPASMKALQKFLSSAPAQNFDLAPASAYLKNSG